MVEQGLAPSCSVEGEMIRTRAQLRLHATRGARRPLSKLQFSRDRRVHVNHTLCHTLGLCLSLFEQ